MYESLIAERLGKRIAEMRVNRGMNKVQFAKQLGTEAERIGKGLDICRDVLLLSSLESLGCELEVIPRRFPTLEELSDVFA